MNNDYIAQLAAAVLSAPVSGVADAVRALENEGRYYAAHSIKGWEAQREEAAARRELEADLQWVRRDLEASREVSRSLLDSLDSADREIVALRAALRERDEQLRAARRRLLDVQGGDSLAKRALAAEVLWDAARAGAGWEVARDEYEAVVGESHYPAE